MIPRNLGPDTQRFTIPPGVVCDDCDSWLGRQVDAPFADRFDMKLTRGLEGLAGRAGAPPLTIDGRDAIARLDLEIEGAKVTIYAARAHETADGGLDIEIRPRHRDPDDIVARTFRALWKIALGCAWLSDRDASLDPRWDYMREVILGAPFRGYLLQAPFTAQVTRRLDVNVNFTTPAQPSAMTFVMGGVTLSVPLAPGAKVDPADAHAAGWEVHPTEAAAPDVLHFRLEPSEV